MNPSARFSVVAGVGAIIALAPAVRAQTALANPNFEAGPRDSAPSGWIARAPAGYRIVVVDSGAFQGRQAVLLDGTGAAGGFAVILQHLDGAPLRGRRVRYRAFVRAELTGPAVWSALWLRVDRPDSQPGFFDNMSDRPIQSPAWHVYEITGEVAEDASSVFIGALLEGAGRMWVDSVTIEVLAPQNPADLPPASAAALGYLDAALGIIERGSINRLRVDWPALRARARGRIAGAQRPAETYIAIRQALTELGDRHSFFMPPQRSAAFAAGGASFPDSNARLVDGRFGYLRVPAYAGKQPDSARRFAEGMQRAIRRLDGPGTCGWIVDLRGNGGGNMWPMLAGLGPLVGDGVAGSFVVPRGNQTSWAYRDGVLMRGGSVDADAPRDPYRLLRPGSPVAVLTDGQTASSGEAVAISFRGLPNARSFGAATGGFSSANQGFPLPDSAMILLTVALDADRTGILYGGPIEPDESVASEAGRDAALAAAVRWLDTRCHR